MKQKNLILMVVAVGCGLVAAFLTTQMNAKPKVETLEATIPYAAFKKIALSQSVQMQVGASMFELREKNRLALKDLDSRVIN